MDKGVVSSIQFGRIFGKYKSWARWSFLHGKYFTEGPCLGVLATRHISKRVQCPVCSVGFEDIQHCLFSCHIVKKIWEELGLWDEVSKAIAFGRSGSAIMEHLLFCSPIRLIDNDLKNPELTWQCQYGICGGNEGSWSGMR